MTNPTLQKRTLTYGELSTALSYLDNSTMIDLFDNALKTTKGWGVNHVVEVGGHSVFVKRIPLSDLLYSHPYSTKNWHCLPTFYNYPVGSAGINPFRELAVHSKTTGWVLSGQCDHFPLLYHHRILPRQPNTEPINEDNFKNYLARWNNSKQVRDYILARRNASQELVLFVEYFPHELRKWFQSNMSATDSILAQMKELLRFMHAQRFLHFDLTFNNMMTDGEQLYLGDFGMTLDWDFDLSPDERTFFERNTLLDFGMFFKNLAFNAVIMFDGLPAEEKGRISAELNLSGADTLTAQDKLCLLEQLGSVSNTDRFSFPQSFVDAVSQYQPIILLMQAFIGKMLENTRKDTVYDYERLDYLVRNAGLLS